MFLQKLNLTPFFAPPVDTGAIEDKALSKEETIEFLNEDEPETIELEKAPAKAKETKSPDKTGEEKPEEVEEEVEKSLEDEIEEELKEETPDEEKLELIAPVRRKEILAKYPEIFKDFPYLEKAMYREKAYTEILPTIEDAKVAVEKSERLDTYEEQIMGGSTELLLEAVFNTDREAFSKVVDNYLPTLYKVDQAAYYHTVGNVIKNAIMAMVRDGKEHQNDDLMGAADIINQYIFGTKTFTPPQRLAKGETKPEEDKQVSEREQQFVQRQFETARDTVTSKTDNVLKSTIEKNIDPNESMTDYVRKHASSEAFDTLEKAIEQDSRFKIVLDKLWERAFNDDFSSESMDRIKSAYLSKAKTLLPGIIKSARNEALRGLGKRVRNEEADNLKDRKGPVPVGKTRSTSTSPQSGKTVKDAARSIPKGMSSYDYLNQD